MGLTRWLREVLGYDFDGLRLRRVVRRLHRICSICGKETNDYSADPGEWGVQIPFTGGNGCLKNYHAGCLAKLVEERSIECI